MGDTGDDASSRREDRGLHVPHALSFLLPRYSSMAGHKPSQGQMQPSTPCAILRQGEKNDDHNHRKP